MENPGRQKDTIIFKSKPGLEGLSMYENGHGLWTDFDYTVIFPYVDYED